MKKNLYLVFLFLLYFSISSTVNSAFTPIENTSWNRLCHYSMSWVKADGTTFYEAWEPVTCDANLDFRTLLDDWELRPDGIYTLSLKAMDSTDYWTVKSYISETATTTENKYGITTWWPFKVDTTPPTCVLKQIVLSAGKSNNMYYNSGNLYYKANWGSWEFRLVIESDDTNNGAWPNTSKLQKIEFPTLLWSDPSDTVYWAPMGSKVTLTWVYSWSWNQTETWNILDNLSRTFCHDYAWNSSPLKIDATTKLVIEDTWEEIVWITSLVLVPDSTVPTVNSSVYNTTSNGFSFERWNDPWSWTFINMYSGVTDTRFFSATDSKLIKVPQFRDTNSWLRTFSVRIENHNNISVLNSYTKNLSTKDTKITSLIDRDVIHNFSLVDNHYNWTTWYRSYDWDIQTLDLAWNLLYTDQICDMVWNCLTIPTPSFKVVANSPIIASNTNLLTWTLWTKHNLNSTFMSDSTNKRANMSDAHTTIVNFEDKYWNSIVPISWVKNVELRLAFDNTMGCNQYASPNSWNCVDYNIKNLTSPLVWSVNPSVTERHNLFYRLASSTQFRDWNITMDIVSAIPTKQDYLSVNWDELYWTSLNPRLQLNNLNIKVNNTTSLTWVWENLAALELSTTTATKPTYRWAPIINYNNIWEIYPILEWQKMSVTLSKVVNDNSRLTNYNLYLKHWTNNSYLQFNNTHLTNGNISDGWMSPSGTEDYYIVKNFSPPAWKWRGNIIYPILSDKYNFTAKTVGWVSFTNTNVALYWILNYTVWGKSVSIPSIQSWFNYYWLHDDSHFLDTSKYDSNSIVEFSEIDVRWITQTNNDASTPVDSSNKFVDFSTIKLYDIKTQINKNVENLLAWSDRNIWTTWSSSINSFDLSSAWWLKLHNNSVVYFKDRDITIDCFWTCNINGKKTIIVENGNIFLKSNLNYANANSILWFILIWNTANGNKSQFRISENITNWVWVVYSDWPILSVDNSNNLIYDWTTPTSAYLVNQLYWKWSFATKNTVGWSIKDGVWTCPYGTPDYWSCDLEKAQAYDLIYLRRYARVETSRYPWIIWNPMWDGKIPFNIDSISVKTAGWDSYAITTWVKTPWILPKPSDYSTNDKTRNSPLIIEYDPNIQTNPPLWFSNN